jgi:hypothetical protein
MPSFLAGWESAVFQRPAEASIRTDCDLGHNNLALFAVLVFGVETRKKQLERITAEELQVEVVPAR